jgi:N utilization substance protein A
MLAANRSQAMNDDSNDTEVIWKLLRKHVPEMRSGLIKVLGIAREPGQRSVLAVASNDPRIDAVGTCIGLRGYRAKGMVAELGGREMIDVVRWDDSAERFIANLLAPLRLDETSFDEAAREAKVVVEQRDAPGKPDVALRSKLLMDLTGWKLHLKLKDEG